MSKMLAALTEQMKEFQDSLKEELTASQAKLQANLVEEIKAIQASQAKAFRDSLKIAFQDSLEELKASQVSRTQTNRDCMLESLSESSLELTEVEKVETGEPEIKERRKELETTDDAEQDEAKPKVEETGQPEINESPESPVGKAKDKKCKKGRPLIPKLFEYRRITCSPKETSNVSKENCVRMVCLLDESHRISMPHWWTETVMLENLREMQRKMLILTFDPGLSRTFDPEL